MSKSVCIINSFGCLGAELTFQLLKNGFNVTGIVPSIFNARDMDHINTLQNMYPGSVNIYECGAMIKDSLLPIVNCVPNVSNSGFCSPTDLYVQIFCIGTPFSNTSDYSNVFQFEQNMIEVCMASEVTTR